jgi:hypothetical protein
VQRRRELVAAVDDARAGAAAAWSAASTRIACKPRVAVPVIRIAFLLSSSLLSSG